MSDNNSIISMPYSRCSALITAVSQLTLECKHLSNTATSAPPPPTPPPLVSAAQLAALGTTELLEAILAQLPLEDIYRAGRVCQFWRYCIGGDWRGASQQSTGSPTLQRLLFLLVPAEAPAPLRVQFQGLWTTPVEVNPLLRRVVHIYPGERYGDLAALAVLGPSDPAATKSGFPLWENLLDVEIPAVTTTTSKPTSSPLDSPSPPPTDEHSPDSDATPPRPPPPPPVLTDHTTRPLIDVSALSVEIPYQHRVLAVAPTGQAHWKGTYFSYPPTHELRIRRPDRAITIQYTSDKPLRLGDVLDALEDLRATYPAEWPAEECEVQDFEILLPLRGADGGAAPSLHGSGVWRALKTRLRCRIEGAVDLEAVLEPWQRSDAVGSPIGDLTEMSPEQVARELSRLRLHHH
ncbi:hypothetical protein LTR08_000808 [Meristemomyces frigidus]|nr:hypothetical protein LTR08_000808 [Meristemomyces frigidus]